MVRAFETPERLAPARDAFRSPKIPRLHPDRDNEPSPSLPIANVHLTIAARRPSSPRSQVSDASDASRSASRTTTPSWSLFT